MLSKLIITEAGQNSKSSFIAYGDDSAYEEILIYGFVICERSQASKLEKEVINIKKEFGIPDKIPIHMKSLLSGQYRKKNNISNFGRSQQSLFFEKVVNILNKNRCIVRYCYTVVPDSGKIFPKDSPDEEIPLIENHKATIHQMAAACFTPYIENGRLIFTAKDFEVFLSHDSTKVKFSPKSPRKQAHFLSELLIPTTNPPKPGTYIRLKPNIQLMKKNILLQFTDVVVYILSHALSKNCKEDIFRHLANRIIFFIRHTLVTEINQEEIGIEHPSG